MLGTETLDVQDFNGLPGLILLREIASVISAGREEDSWSEVRCDLTLGVDSCDQYIILATYRRRSPKFLEVM
jgi:hypothetical protein